MTAKRRAARKPEDISSEDVARALDALAKLVDARLPERFYDAEPVWRKAATALAARSAQIARAIGCLYLAGHDTEAVVLFRSLYEHTVVVAWVLAAPETRADAWVDSGHARMRAIHQEALQYGVTVLDAERLERARGARKLPSLLQMANEVDEFWPGRIAGFRARLDEVSPVNLLTLTGMYTGLYRRASPRAHGEATGLEGVTGTDERGRLTVRWGDDPAASFLPLAVPVFAMGLTAIGYRLPWPDVDEVKRINEDLLRD